MALVTKARVDAAIPYTAGSSTTPLASDLNGVASDFITDIAAKQDTLSGAGVIAGTPTASTDTLLGLVGGLLRQALVGSWFDDWTNGAIGAVYRTLRAKVGYALDVRDFGAVGDGTTDDSAAFTAYLAHINASAVYNTTAPWVDNQFNRYTRKVFRIPPGDYRVRSRLCLDTSAWTNATTSLVFEGQGVGLSRVIFDPVEPNTVSGTIGTVTDAHTMVLAVGSSAVDDFYVGSRIFFATGDTNSLVATVLGYTAATRTAKLSIDISPLPVAGTTTYTIKGIPYVGTAASGTTTTLVLAVGDANVALFNANSPVGMRVWLTGGTGSGADGLIVGWTSATRTLTMGRTFTLAGADVTPDSTSVYRIQGHCLFRNERASSVRYLRVGFDTVASKALFCWSDRKSGYTLGDNSGVDASWIGWSRCFENRNTYGNNNDTSYFFGCRSDSIEEDFIRLVDSDQELHFAFYNHFHIGSRGPLVNADKGGSIFVYGLDCSAWGHNAVKDSYIFELDASPAAAGVKNFVWRGGRVEVMANNQTARILRCSWDTGTVSLDGVDLDSQAPFYGYNYPLFYFNTGNFPGPQAAWRSCKMVGKINIEYNASASIPEGAFQVQDCGWFDQLTFLPVTPDDVVVFTQTGAHANVGMSPTVVFDNCRRSIGTRYTNYERYVWDCVIGWRTHRYGATAQKVLGISGPFAGLGTTADPQDATTYFPVGSLITAVHIYAPAGATGGTQTAQVIYDLKTEAGTVIATVTIPAPNSAYDIRVVPTAGAWDCNSDANRRIKLSPRTGITGYSYNAVPMIEWIG